MSNRDEIPNNSTTGTGSHPAAKPRPTGDQPGFVDGVPVEDLVKLAREFTARVTNEDRQRLALEINESGHQRSIQTSAPFLLQQFFTGKIDLDVELARRFPGPPLLTSPSFTPAPGKPAKHGFAQYNSQDNSAAFTIEMHGPTQTLDFSFLLQGMISLRFTLGAIAEHNRRRFLELMHRDDGIAFLWTRERWERDYLIFVVRDHFARLYAFGPGRFDAACRLTPDGLNQLLDWLAGFWIMEPEATPPPSEPEDSPSSAFNW